MRKSEVVSGKEALWRSRIGIVEDALIGATKKFACGMAATAQPDVTIGMGGVAEMPAGSSGMKEEVCVTGT